MASVASWETSGSRPGSDHAAVSKTPTEESIGKSLLDLRRRSIRRRRAIIAINIDSEPLVSSKRAALRQICVNISWVASSASAGVRDSRRDRLHTSAPYWSMHSPTAAVSPWAMRLSSDEFGGISKGESTPLLIFAPYKKTNAAASHEGSASPSDGADTTRTRKTNPLWS